MPKKKTPIHLIVGISILLLVPISIGAAITSTLQADEKEQQETEEAIIENSPFSDAKSKQSIETRPLPTTESVGSGRIENQIEGIPTGTYSSPPASVGSSAGDVSETSRPLEDFDASTEQNQLNQQQNNSLVPDYSLAPDYSSPSASNNFNRTDDNSLIEPLEDDSFLEVPDSSNSPTSITPTTSPFGSNSGL